MTTPSKSNGFQFDVPTVIAGALTLTAALAWNETAKAGIQSLYPDPDGSSFHATLVYAIVVTILIIIVFAVMRALTRAADSRRKGSMTAGECPSVSCRETCRCR